MGGGIIGSSIAMALSERRAGRIGLVDVDLSGILGSTERNAGGVRATWGERVNIALADRSISFYESVASEVGFHQKGYLWLYTEEGWKKGADRRALQEKAGLIFEGLSPSDIQRRFPYLDRLDDVAAATFSPRDGLINPNLLKLYYRKKGSEKGVVWIDHHAVESLSVEGGRIRSVTLRELGSEGSLERFLKEGVLPEEGASRVIEVQATVNAAGAWAPRLAKLYGKEVPSVPIRRQVTVAHSQQVDLSPYGMTVDTTGLYFHHEAGNVLAGYSIPSEPAGYRFDYDGYDFFLQEVWPRLAARGSGFDQLRYVGGWAGLYEVSPDKSAIIGRVEGIANLYEAHSFSGRGVMQSYGAGQGLAELITEGGYRTIDLASLSGERFKKGKRVPEGLHI